MFNYIQKDVPKFFFENTFDFRTEKCFLMGETYEDFLNGCFIMMTDEQITFHNEHPNASVKEVIELKIDNPVRTIEQAKQEMILNITKYDISSNVNGFTINNTITTWFSQLERLNYQRSVDSAKLLGVDTLSFFVGNNALSVSTQNAEMMLAALQLYADECFIVTKQHKLAVNNLTTIEEVDNYDYKSGYPQKPNFNL